MEKMVRGQGQANLTFRGRLYGHSKICYDMYVPLNDDDDDDDEGISSRM